MKKYKLLWVFSFLLVGCQGVESTLTPPKELVGSWVEVSEKTDFQITPELRTAASKACAGFEVTDKGVSYGLLKIKEDGSVYSLRNVKNTNELYHFEGTVDGDGVFYPSEEAKKDYLGNALKEAEKNNMQVVAKITLDYEQNSIKGNLIEMSIDTKLVAGGLEISYPMPNRFFSQTTQAAEQNLTSKIKTCLQGIP